MQCDFGRLLYAKTLFDDRSAIVVQLPDGRLIGGVVWLTSVRINTRFGDAGTNDMMNMSFIWQWWRIVESPEEFADKREWESISTPRPLLEHKQ